ncbi:DUF4846 domain-containing protein [Flammeovirga kamogawensis]|uniref:DUF4846 domain-containing protein n=1 Tax=Flammeovirga kamogawensis TaxID=373891 RepID=A0ABX8H4U4_9BACT|nr:DUF4846 domain-containing protein [Flammeovirga kamogawensis]MBB6463552.1 hypothetical protein [Flammeovirga kamogawensis]QWG10607.1 DUF4846 domain-containing protein [Flammeovirga kamogawensis]TRX63712.1 hypothetical protein EO216_25190 [Flammeovirga kamogawensis]
MKQFTFSTLQALFLLFFSTVFVFTAKAQNTQNTVVARVPSPDNYSRTTLPDDSFGTFLRTMPLLPKGAPILDYNGDKIYNQNEHIGIINYDVGKKDLQQCADAVIRLYAEYLWEQKRFDEITFHFTSGHAYAWNQYKKGIRPIVSGNKVTFKTISSPNNSYEAFRKYLDYVYMYAGTISINKEMKKVASTDKIKIGDVIVTPGSPGHAVIIIDEAVNTNGDKIFLLAEGYTPAQSIHILKNPFDTSLQNWYVINNEAETETARYTFYTTNIRRF